MRAMVLGVSVMMAMAGPAQAVDDYDTCLSLIAQDADKAQRDAGHWARFGGGGAPARHCYALALIEAGAPLRAADELIAIAQEEPNLPNRARADLLIQAGELLVSRDQPLTAGVVADGALQLVPDDPAALGLRAAVLLENDKPRAAHAVLTKALAKAPKSVTLLLRRSRAHRAMGNDVAARDDASFATEQAPDSAPAWAERGRAEAALGFKADARQSFLRAIGLDRKGPVGRAAQVDLQRMEVGIKE